MNQTVDDPKVDALQSELVSRLAKIADTMKQVCAVAESFPYGYVHHKPDEIAFSATEIIYHLADVERLWQSRIAILLRDGTAEFKKFDPDTTARANNYNVSPFRDGILQFQRERGRTIEQIRSLTETQLSFAGHHPKFGRITILDILEIIANHDLGHAEQFRRTEKKVVL